MGFSKVIHLVWFQGFASAPAHVRGTPALWRGENPGYSIMEWDQESLHTFICYRYPQYIRRWCQLDRVIKQCDMARLLLAHHYGGVYADADLIPLQGIDSFLDSGEVRRQQVYNGKLREAHRIDRVDLRARDVILSAEHRAIDSVGVGVANGLLISAPRLPMWLEFVESRVDSSASKVLDFMGPHALTRFLRERAQAMRGKGIIVPPQYFLWEEHAMKEPPPAWVVSKHPAINSWGDPTRVDWWNV